MDFFGLPPEFAQEIYRISEILSGDLIFVQLEYRKQRRRRFRSIPFLASHVLSNLESAEANPSHALTTFEIVLVGDVDTGAALRP
jgi:hypothetical protein